MRKCKQSDIRFRAVITADSPVDGDGEPVLFMGTLLKAVADDWVEAAEPYPCLGCNRDFETYEEAVAHLGAQK